MNSENIFEGMSLQLFCENSIYVDGNQMVLEQPRIEDETEKFFLYLCTGQRIRDCIFIPRFQDKFQMNI